MECPDKSPPLLQEVTQNPWSVTFHFNEAVQVQANSSVVGTARAQSEPADWGVSLVASEVEIREHNVTVLLASLNFAPSSVTLDRLVDMSGNPAAPIEEDVDGVRWGQSCLQQSKLLCGVDWQLSMEIASQAQHGGSLACSSQGAVSLVRRGRDVTATTCASDEFVELAKRLFVSEQMISIMMTTTTTTTTATTYTTTSTTTSTTSVTTASANTTSTATTTTITTTTTTTKAVLLPSSFSEQDDEDKAAYGSIVVVILLALCLVALRCKGRTIHFALRCEFVGPSIEDEPEANGGADVENQRQDGSNANQHEADPEGTDHQGAVLEVVVV